MVGSGAPNSIACSPDGWRLEFLSDDQPGQLQVSPRRAVLSSGWRGAVAAAVSSFTSRPAGSLPSLRPYPSI
jgi:hypothetical protein